MQRSQSSSLLLFVIFVSCFVTLIVLTNTYTTQYHKREELEKTIRGYDTQIDSFLSQSQQQANDQITIYGRKNGIVPYSNDELFKLPPALPLP
jgi:hypothetical protein